MLLHQGARLTVFTIGRDERLRFWDGLLGADYVGEYGRARSEPLEPTQHFTP